MAGDERARTEQLEKFVTRYLSFSLLACLLSSSVLGWPALAAWLAAAGVLKVFCEAIRGRLE